MLNPASLSTLPRSSPSCPMQQPRQRFLRSPFPAACRRRPFSATDPSPNPKSPKPAAATGPLLCGLRHARGPRCSTLIARATALARSRGRYAARPPNGAQMVTIAAHDTDANRTAGDRDTLTFPVSVLSRPAPVAFPPRRSTRRSRTAPSPPQSCRAASLSSPMRSLGWSAAIASKVTSGQAWGPTRFNPAVRAGEAIRPGAAAPSSSPANKALLPARAIDCKRFPILLPSIPTRPPTGKGRRPSRSQRSGRVSARAGRGRVLA